MPDLDLRRLSSEDIKKIADAGEGEKHERYRMFNRVAALSLARTNPSSDPDSDQFVINLTDEEYKEAIRVLGKGLIPDSQAGNTP